METLNKNRLSSLFVMSNQILDCTRFVAKSFSNPYRSDLDDERKQVTERGYQAAVKDEVQINTAAALEEIASEKQENSDMREKLVCNLIEGRNCHQ